MAGYRATKKWPFHISCGGPVYRETDGRREYLLLFRSPRPGLEQESWHLAKGTLNPDETLEACALREIREESGVEAGVEGYLGTLHGRWTDTTGKLFDKTVHYFLCRYLRDGDAPMDDEHDRVDWLPVEEALERLSRGPKREAEILLRAEQLLALRQPPAA